MLDRINPAYLKTLISQYEIRDLLTSVNYINTNI